MNSLPIVALIGMAVLVTATVGFGASISTTPTFNFIGASDNNIVTAARGNVTELKWIEEVSPVGNIETDAITYTVGNEDTASSHIFEICAVIEILHDNASTGFSPAPGTNPACTTTTLLIASTNSTIQFINFTTAVDVDDIVDISFSVEELQ